MKFLHLSDLHLGRSLGDFDLIEDQRFILEQILDIITRESADAVLIAGDVYDKAIPSEAAVNLLNEFLCRLAERKVHTFIISGNHDSDDRLNFGSRLFESSRIYISSVFDGRLHSRVLEDAYGEVSIYMLPFVKASQVRHFYPEEEIGSYEDAVRVILAHAGIDTSRRNVILAHQFVAGGGDPELGGSESAGTRSVGLVEKIGSACFDAFDYAALGHIHSPQGVGRREVRYAGSPLKYSLSEAFNDKSVPVVTLGEKGDVSVKLVPLRPLRDLRHLKGPLRQLLSKENVRAPEDFIYVTLTDEEIIDDAMGIVRQVYPNTVRLDFDNAHTRDIGNADIFRTVEQKTFPELIREFYRMIYGCEISEEEMAMMKAAAEEAGVIGKGDGSEMAETSEETTLNVGSVLAGTPKATLGNVGTTSAETSEATPGNVGTTSAETSEADSEKGGNEL